jgi:hypothetical protein
MRSSWQLLSPATPGNLHRLQQRCTSVVPPVVAQHAGHEKQPAYVVEWI